MIEVIFLIGVILVLRAAISYNKAMNEFAKETVKSTEFTVVEKDDLLYVVPRTHGKGD